jgi:hypothetical protein
MPNLHIQIHPVFIPMTSRVKIWDFRLRISDWWNRYALSINGQNSLNLNSKIKNLKLHPTCRGTKMGLNNLSENKQFAPPQAQEAHHYFIYLRSMCHPATAGVKGNFRF